VDEPLASLPACPPFPSFTEFEAKALEAIAELFGDKADEFRQQVARGEVIDRINTIHGFYTRVRIGRGESRPVEIAHQGGHFAVEGLQHGVGVTVWGDDGYLETIEGYTYDYGGLEGWQLSELKLLRVEQLG
jgi:hypothetical protein